VALSRTTHANIWQNVTLALGLKAVFLATTLMSISSRWMAILADTGATLFWLRVTPCGFWRIGLEGDRSLPWYDRVANA
jgi:hypothetical protein